MAATLTVYKICSVINRETVTLHVEGIAVIEGQIHFIPTNKRYQHYKFTMLNSLIVVATQHSKPPK